MLLVKAVFKGMILFMSPLNLNPLAFKKVKGLHYNIKNFNKFKIKCCQFKNLRLVELCPDDGLQIDS